MKEQENIESVLQLRPFMMGFIYYKQSSRYVDRIPSGIDFGDTLKVGVFVDEDIDVLIATYKVEGLDYVQLHGSESRSYCQELSDNKVKMIKAFRVDDDFDFEDCIQFEGIGIDYFLFDAKGRLPGGNGISYDWEGLNNYIGEASFLLSGGIGIGSVAAIKTFEHKKCIGVDVNSGFEMRPGYKDVDKLQRFINSCNN